jgi:rare lipoprotein A (peptidoglycan hydrolase)
MVGTALPNQRVGTASWYASPFGSDSCATKEYVPKGTILKVTNLDTGASTTCRVADRVEANRVVDLDDDVFRQLAPKSQGVFNARIDW